MQMIFNPGGQQGPNKSEGLDEGAPTSPWANLLSVGLKILSAFLGGGVATGDGIDKVDNGSPMQVGNFYATETKIIVNTMKFLINSFGALCLII